MGIWILTWKTTAALTATAGCTSTTSTLVDCGICALVTAIIDTCNATRNSHFQWFAKLLDSHFEGIIAHASLPISSGKMEGINNKIKTLRRQAYGFPDDEYFFLKLIDARRRGYVGNSVSHKLFH